MKNTLLILGHPNKNSLNGKLLEFYEELAKSKERNIRKILLGDLNFNPILNKGYNEIQELEPDLKKAQVDILWADHLVFFFPVWWYNLPALLKGFIDRVFLPGFAFKYQENSAIPERLLNGKTASIICTSGTPRIFYYFLGKNNGHKVLKNILKFCGIKTKNKVIIGSVLKNLPAEKLQDYKKKISKII